MKCFRRNAAETACQSELRQSPAQPFGRIPLPRLHAIAVIVLKFVVIIVIAFAESEYRHQKRIARAASCRIRLAPDCMAGRVNQERAVLEHDHLGYTANQETSERADPSVPPRAEQRGQGKTHEHSE